MREVREVKMIEHAGLQQERPVVKRPDWLWKCPDCGDDDWELTQKELDEIRAYIEYLEARGR